MMFIKHQCTFLNKVNKIDLTYVQIQITVSLDMHNQKVIIKIILYAI